MTAVRDRPGIDSPYAWRLAFVSMFCIGLGGGALYLPVIGLKEIAAEFGDRRAVPSMAYMLGFFFGNRRRPDGLAGRPHESRGCRC
jgi:hypothetical protein